MAQSSTTEPALASGSDLPLPLSLGDPFTREPLSGGGRAGTSVRSCVREPLRREREVPLISLPEEVERRGPPRGSSFDEEIPTSRFDAVCGETLIPSGGVSRGETPAVTQIFRSACRSFFIVSGGAVGSLAQFGVALLTLCCHFENAVVCHDAPNASQQLREGGKR
jgi:hypothetical protein